MDGLRWLLLLFGLLVVAGVYLYSRREKTPTEDDDAISHRVAPRLDGADLQEDADSMLDADDGAEAPDEQPVATNQPQKIVTVRIVAREKKAFAGDELILTGQQALFYRFYGEKRNDDRGPIGTDQLSAYRIVVMSEPLTYLSLLSHNYVRHIKQTVILTSWQI